MNSAAPPRNAQQPSQKTLGDLLYANQSQACLSEKDWLKKIRSIARGDQLALNSVFEQTHRLVFTLIVRITHNRETAEELTLDVFHDVWRRAATYDPANGSVVGWIMNQARSRAIDRIRFDGRKKRVQSETYTGGTHENAEDPENACCMEQQSRQLKQALEVLTPEERHVIETAFFSELTHQETAFKLKQPVGTVKSRIRSGLSKLRRALTGVVDGR